MKRLLLFAMIFTFAALGVSSANSVYLAQTAQGSNNGTSCSNAYAATYFNTSGNWTSGTPTGEQIGLGTTVYLCPSGGTMSTTLTFQGNGSSGSPVVLDGSNGVSFNAQIYAYTAYWTIQNITWPTTFDNSTANTGVTADGTAAIMLNGACSFGTISGNTLDISNYNHGNPFSGSNTNSTSMMIFADSNETGPCHDIVVENNLFRNAAQTSPNQIDIFDTSGISNLTIEGNYFETRVEDDTSGTTGCADSGGACHDDQFQAWSPDGNVITANSPHNITVRYNEFVMNTTTQYNRSFFMVQGIGAGYFDVYGNVFIGIQGAHQANGMVCCSPDSTSLIYHVYDNTYVEYSNGPANMIWVTMGGASPAANLDNNIFYVTDAEAMQLDGGDTLNRATNLWYNVGTGTLPSCSSTSDICGSNPNFSNVSAETAQGLTLGSTSPAIGAGTNLGTSWCGIGSGCSLYPTAGTTWPGPATGTRPSSGAWDVGAYEYQSGLGQAGWTLNGVNLKGLTAQ